MNPYNPRILIIDDEASFARLLQMNLDELGLYSVRAVSQSQEALQTAREFQPDVILLDIVMSGLDGGDLEALFSRDAYLRHVPIVFLTALVSNEDNESGKTNFVDGRPALGKPVSVGKLRHTIDRCMAESPK